MFSRLSFIITPFPIPKEWFARENQLKFNLEDAADFGFLPLDNYKGEVLFNTKSHGLKLSYERKSEQIS